MHEYLMRVCMRMWCVYVCECIKTDCFVDTMIFKQLHTYKQLKVLGCQQSRLAALSSAAQKNAKRARTRAHAHTHTHMHTLTHNPHQRLLGCLSNCPLTPLAAAGATHAHTENPPQCPVECLHCRPLTPPAAAWALQSSCLVRLLKRPQGSRCL